MCIHNDVSTSTVSTGTFYLLTSFNPKLPHATRTRPNSRTFIVSFFVPPTCSSRKSSHLPLATVPYDFTITSGENANLRQPQVEKTGKIGHPPQFGRDRVTRGSSGLKPFRRCVPRVQSTRHQSVLCQYTPHRRVFFGEGWGR